MQCELESSQTSELQLTERVRELQATVLRLQAESESQSNAARDCSEDDEFDVIHDLRAEKVSTKFTARTHYFGIFLIF